jgi:hypothetical protein
MWVSASEWSRFTKVVAVASRLALRDGGEHDWGKRLPARPGIRVVCGQAISGSPQSSAPQRAVQPLDISARYCKLLRAKGGQHHTAGPTRFDDLAVQAEKLLGCTLLTLSQPF